MEHICNMYCQWDSWQFFWLNFYLKIQIRVSIGRHLFLLWYGVYIYGLIVFLLQKTRYYYLTYFSNGSIIIILLAFFSKETINTNHRAIQVTFILQYYNCCSVIITICRHFGNEQPSFQNIRFFWQPKYICNADYINDTCYLQLLLSVYKSKNPFGWHIGSWLICSDCIAMFGQHMSV